MKCNKYQPLSLTGCDKNHRSALGLVINIAGESMMQPLLEVAIRPPHRLPNEPGHAFQQLRGIAGDDKAACDYFRVFAQLSRLAVESQIDQNDAIPG